MCYGAAMPKETYQYLTLREDRQDLVAITKGIAEYAKKVRAQNIVLVDRAARPLATALLEYWKIVDPAGDHPRIYFLNPDGFSQKRLGISFFGSGARIVGLDIGVERVPHTLDMQREMGNRFKEGYQELYAARMSPTIIFDTCAHTGGTLAAMVAALKKLGFSSLKVGVASQEGDLGQGNVQIDFSFDKIRKCSTCAPFGKDSGVRKRSDISCEPLPRSPKGVAAHRHAVGLRKEIRTVVSRLVKK